ncbi:MFS transporter [Archaeoglobus veneficus]|uniref:Major facilitator superfamily MFS_1 n=1 Tax=Archaeoglobus veneficus (strain DSM 11195 / SNP6) TaxID=693661 RepID=F2KP11_ARCVS|nr:MFS transporter [Archaeoglobus veneficus]AEA46319.1 major facilitator superfamily MFS_1 [Archaeoglobus veneficus SNP6]
MSLSVLFTAVFAAMLGLGIVVPLLPEYAESLGASGFWIGAVFAGFAFSRAVFTPFVGSASDKLGRRPFIILGLLFYTIISVTYLFADSVYTLTAVRVLHGVASAMIVPVAMAYTAELSPKGQEGKYMGSFTVSLFLGMGLGPLIGGVIKDTLGMPYVFLSMAALSAVSLLICIVSLPESKAKGTRNASLKAAVKNRLIKAMMLFRFQNAFCVGAIMAFLPLLAHSLGLSSTQIGFVITSNVLLSAMLQRFFGNVADRHNRALLVIIGSIVGTTSPLLIPLASSFLQLLLLSLLSGLGTAIALPAATAIATVAGREVGQGSAMGAFNTAMSVGMITSPIVSGFVKDVLNVKAVFYVAALVSFTIIAVFSRMILKVQNVCNV